MGEIKRGLTAVILSIGQLYLGHYIVISRETFGDLIMAELTLWQDVALKVKDLQVRFDTFETQNRLSDCVVTEIDEELEEGRVSLEKLEKRVRELETDLPELIAERVATLKTENAELRIHHNLLVDVVNNLTTIWNEQVHEGEQQQQTEVIDEQVMEDNEVLTLLQDQPPQLTLEEVYNMYQSQPQTEEEWEEMNKAIKAAVAYENSLPNGTKIRLAKTDWTSGSPQ